jgi:hypothetical protein
MQATLHLSSSWPGIAVRRTASLPLAYARPSTSLLRDCFEKVVPIGIAGDNFPDPSTCHVEILQDVDGRDKPGHDENS